MREDFAPLEGNRYRWRGTVAKFGQKRVRGQNRKQKTILLRQVREVVGRAETDHAWLRAGRWCEGLLKGDIIYFNATVQQYIKGDFMASWKEFAFENAEYDYKLTRPGRVVVAERKRMWV